MVACTRFCEQSDLAHVGGTKDPAVGEIVALAPDLVVVDREENRREDADALVAAGLRLHVTHVISVDDVTPTLRSLAVACDVPADAVADVSATLRPDPPRLRAFVPIWRRPWMSIGSDTYGSTLLARLGVENVCAASPDRYPEVTLEEIAGAQPDVALLPSEPYPFADRHRAEIEAAIGVPTVLVDGADLFWWGVRTPGACRRLRDVLRAVPTRRT